MALSSFAVSHFLGGELSAFGQGRFDRPDYRNSTRISLNSFPVESGPWTRRSGTMFAGMTLNGKPGRVIRFDNEAAAPFTCEYTDGNLRFRSGATVFGATLATPFTGGSWAAIRPVQAEATQILLTPTVAPQALVATNVPGANPSFALSPAIFNDGPYLDSFINGVQATPGSKTGIVTLTLAFPAYDSGKTYAVGSFVTASSVNYRSLIDQNVGNTPASTPSAWAVTSASAAINGGLGFLGTDIGRLVRLFSEPAAWVAGSTYGAGAVVSYNATGQPGAATYWQSAAGSNTGNIPGTDLTHWTLIPTGAAIWSWGKIVSLSNGIDRGLSGSLSFGDMTGGGGLDAAFDGAFAQAASASAEKTTSSLSLTSYVGKDYSASAQKIQSATIYPSSDLGFASGTAVPQSGGIGGGGAQPATIATTTFNLRASATLPGSASDGTLLGTSGAIANSFSAVSITSSDQTTSWAYVWIEQISTILSAATLTNAIGQLSFFGPPGSGTSSGVNIELLGAPLLYTTPIATWRLGVYSATTGWPTCGLYDDGRIWLGGAVANRIDACYANGISGTALNFAPTDQYGQVTTAHAISYTFNSKGVNPIFWLKPDLQGIKAGTKAGEWLIRAPTSGPISALNITAKQVTSHGSANIEPVDTEHTMIFVQRHGRKLLEYFPDVFSGKFSAPNLADKTSRAKSGVVELAYTSAVNSTLWARMADGSFASMAYKRDSLASSQPPTYYAWSGHALGSGRLVESICSGPSVGGDLDALTMVTNDPATGQRWVEILTDTQDELTAFADSWFLDAGVTPTVKIGSTDVTLTGLPYRNNSTVQVFCSGLDLGDIGEGKPYSDFEPIAGEITIPYGDGVSAGPGGGLFTLDFARAGTFVVGYTYNSDGQMMRPIMPADSGARSGPALGKISRTHKCAVKLVNTRGLTIGRDFSNLKPAALRRNPDDPGTAIKPLETFSGIAYGSVDDDYARDNSLCWRISRPFPAIVVAINAMLSTEDE